MLSPLLTLTSVAAILRNRASTRPADSALRAGHGFMRGVSSSKAWLVMFGFVRHYGLSPFLIRTGESLGARRPRHVSSAEFGVENVAPCRSRNEMLLVQSSMPASWRMSRRVAARRRTRRLRIRAVVQSAPLRQSADGTGG